MSATHPTALSSADRPTPWWVALVALLIADTVYGFQQTAVTPALVEIQHDLNASREWTTWLFSGYLIVASVTPIFLGKLADRSGKRRVYLAALGVFLLGSVVAATSPSIRVLVLARLVQGAGGAVFPLSFSILRDQLPPGRVRGGIGVLTGGFGLGALAGFGIGGLIAQFLSWRWIFGVGAVALAFGMLLVRFTVPASTVRTPRSLDTPGAVLFGGAMAALIVALTEGPRQGWASPTVLGIFALAVAGAGGWVVRELHTSEPLMDLRVLASRPVLLTNMATLMGGYAVLGVNILLPFLLEGEGTAAPTTAFGLAAGPLLIGVVLLPRALGQSVGGPVTGPLARLLGPAPAFAAGLATVAGSVFGMALWRGEAWMLLTELGGLGAGFGLTIGMGGSIVTLAASPAEASIATSINSVLRRVGGGIGAQVAAAILATVTAPGTNVPSPAAFTTSFAVAGFVATVGALCALAVSPRRSRRSR